MKKMVLALIGVSMAFIVSASSFIEGKQYEYLNEPMFGSKKEVIEFFSFYCRHCYVFDKKLQVSKKIKEVVPASIKIKQYHVKFLGTWGEELTKAWIIAEKLGVSDKMKPMLFEAVQTEKKLETKDAKVFEKIIGDIFEKLRKKAEYKSAKKSFYIKSLLKQQEDISTMLKVNSVPTVYINGKYMIKGEGIHSSSKLTYAEKYAEVVRYLLNK